MSLIWENDLKPANSWIVDTKEDQRMMMVFVGDDHTRIRLVQDFVLL